MDALVLGRVSAELVSSVTVMLVSVYGLSCCPLVHKAEGLAAVMYLALICTSETISELRT
jgi:hypothetical protein